MRFLKIFGSIILLVVFVAVAAMSALVYFVDPNKLRPAIVEEVMEQTGYQLAIYGRLNWSYYPVLGIHVPRMTLIAPQQSEPFLDLKNLTIATDIKQLVMGKGELLGDVRISSIVFMNVKMNNAHIGMNWKNKVLSLDPIAANLYGGRLEGEAKGQDLEKVPQWEWQIKALNIRMKPLLTDVNGVNARLGLSGLADMGFRAKTRGLHKEDIISAMKGNGNLTITNGEIEGMDLGYMIKSAEALINKTPLASEDKTGATQFASLTTNVLINNGIAETNDFKFESPVFNAQASGTLNLLHKGVNFNLDVKPELAGKALKWPIPVLVTGSVLSPDVRLDMNKLQGYLAEHELEKVKDKVRDQIKEHIPGDAGKMLNNLLGG